MKQYNVVIFKEKHGKRVGVHETDEELHLICQKVMKERLREGWYDEDDDDWDWLQEGLTDPKIAYRFMMQHSDYEYEGIELLSAETI